MCSHISSELEIVWVGYAFGEGRDRLRQPCRLQRDATSSRDADDYPSREGTVAAILSAALDACVYA